MTQTPKRPVDNVIATKGLQDRNIHILDGTTVENKGKLIQAEASSPKQQSLKVKYSDVYTYYFLFVLTSTFIVDNVIKMHMNLKMGKSKQHLLMCKDTANEKLC